MSASLTKGRGRGYTPARARMDRLWRLLYTGGWARIVADLHPGSSHVEVVRHEVEVPSWPAGEPPLLVAMLSDLHAGPTTSRIALRRAFAATIDARPDVVLLGGDYVLLDASYIHELVPMIAGLRPRLGIFAVLGNHDLWEDDRLITSALSSIGVRILINESVRVGPTQLVGLDDAWTGVTDCEKAFLGVPRSEPIIVLAHSPDSILSMHDRRFDVMICGHTHGGHICLPGGHPIIVPSITGRLFAKGRHVLITGGVLVVSRGIGGAELPFRAWAGPQVILVELKPAIAR